jgi:antitoxin Phd
MKVYTYSEVRQNLASVLEEARRDGLVQIRRRDGKTFELRPTPRRAMVKSPLDVPGVRLGLSRDEIIAFIHSGRRPA